MDISDLLQRPEFAQFAKQLDHEMEMFATPSLILQMTSYRGTYDGARIWFYSANTAFEGKRPYDVCLEGNRAHLSSYLKSQLE